MSTSILYIPSYLASGLVIVESTKNVIYSKLFWSQQHRSSQYVGSYWWWSPWILTHFLGGCEICCFIIGNDQLTLLSDPIFFGFVGHANLTFYQKDFNKDCFCSCYKSLALQKESKIRLHYNVIKLLHNYTITLIHHYTITLLHYYTITLLH